MGTTSVQLYFPSLLPEPRWQKRAVLLPEEVGVMLGHVGSGYRAPPRSFSVADIFNSAWGAGSLVFKVKKLFIGVNILKTCKSWCPKPKSQTVAIKRCYSTNIARNPLKANGSPSTHTRPCFTSISCSGTVLQILIKIRFSSWMVPTHTVISLVVILLRTGKVLFSCRFCWTWNR